MSRQTYYFQDKSEREMEFITQILDDLGVYYKLKQQEVEIPIFGVCLTKAYTICITVEPEMYDYIQYEINKRINERTVLESCLKTPDEQDTQTEDNEINDKKGPMIIKGTITVTPNGVIFQQGISCIALNIHNDEDDEDDEAEHGEHGEDDEDDEEYIQQDCENTIEFLQNMGIPCEVIPLILSSIKNKEEKQETMDNGRSYPKNLWNNFKSKESWWTKLKNLFKK